MTCDVCGFPNPNGTGLIVMIEGHGPERCTQCGEQIDKQGKALGRLLANGNVMLKVILFPEDDLENADKLPLFP